jgi:hypothetical protein
MSLFSPPPDVGVSPPVDAAAAAPSLMENLRVGPFAGRLGLGEIVSSFAALFLALTAAEAFRPFGAALCLPFFAGPVCSVAGVGGCDAFNFSLKPPALPVLAGVGGAGLLPSPEPVFPVLSLSFIDMMDTRHGGGAS